MKKEEWGCGVCPDKPTIVDENAIAEHMQKLHPEIWEEHARAVREEHNRKVDESLQRLIRLGEVETYERDGKTMYRLTEKGRSRAEKVRKLLRDG